MKLKQSETELIRSIEERGAAREREKYAKELQRVTGALATITKRLVNLAGFECEVQFEAEKPQPKKRKAVEANEAEYDAVAQFFQDVRPVGAVISVKTIRRSNIGIGSRIIATACRALVAHGQIETVGRRGYRLVQQKENGLDGLPKSGGPL